MEECHWYSLHYKPVFSAECRDFNPTLKSEIQNPFIAYISIGFSGVSILISNCLKSYGHSDVSPIFEVTIRSLKHLPL